MKLSDKTIALGLALLATVAMASALAAPAGAATYGNGFKVAKFKVEIKGWQNIVQHRSARGRRRVRRQRPLLRPRADHLPDHKPIYITASHMPGEFNPQLFGGPQLGIPARAKVQRSFTPVIAAARRSRAKTTAAAPKRPNPTAAPRSSSSGASTCSSAGRKRTACCSAATATRTRSSAAPARASPASPGCWSKAPATRASTSTPTSPRTSCSIPSSRSGSRSPTARRPKDGGSTWWTKTDVHWEVSFTRLKEKKAGR